MATERQEKSDGQETIPRRVQDKILALCGIAGMDSEQFPIVHRILRDFDNPDLLEIVEALANNRGVPEATRDEFRNALKRVL